LQEIRRLQPLTGYQSSYIEKTAECMKEKQLAGYQLNMLQEQLKDMKN